MDLSGKNCMEWWKEQLQELSENEEKMREDFVARVFPNSEEEDD